MQPQPVFLDDPRFPLFNELVMRTYERGPEGSVGCSLATGGYAKVPLGIPALLHGSEVSSAGMGRIASVLAGMSIPAPMWVEADGDAPGDRFGMLCELPAPGALQIWHVDRGRGGKPAVALPAAVRRLAPPVGAEAEWSAVSDDASSQAPGAARRGAQWIRKNMGMVLWENSIEPKTADEVMGWAILDFMFLAAVLPSGSAGWIGCTKH